MNNLKLFLQAYLRPGRAVSDLMDKGSLVFSVVSILLVGCAFFFTINAQLNAAYHLPDMSDFYPAGISQSDITNSQMRAAATAYTTAMDTHDKVPIVGDA